MPYKIDKEKKLLPRELNRRIKLSETDKIEIDELIKKWLSNQVIADMFWVHRKTIYLIRNPEQAKKEKEDFKLRQSTWIYYNKEKQRKAVANTRKYRYKNKDNLLDNPNHKW